MVDKARRVVGTTRIDVVECSLKDCRAQSQLTIQWRHSTQHSRKLPGSAQVSEASSLKFVELCWLCS